MPNQFTRTEMLLGSEAVHKLKQCRIAVFGIGGVGGYTVEALARSGVGTLDLIDNDTVSITNINRQIIALHSTIGMNKTEAAKKRLLDINPNIKINTYNTFFTPENSGEFNFSQYDYIVDAIDTVSGKIELAVQADKANIPIISSMGAGNKLDPTRFEVSDIFKTSVCPLARVMRRELKKRNIRKLKVVYSKEEALSPKCESDEDSGMKRQTPASIAYVPSVVGLIIAGEVINDIISQQTS